MVCGGNFADSSTIASQASFGRFQFRVNRYRLFQALYRLVVVSVSILCKAQENEKPSGFGRVLQHLDRRFERLMLDKRSGERNSVELILRCQPDRFLIGARPPLETAPLEAPRPQFQPAAPSRAGESLSAARISSAAAASSFKPDAMAAFNR